MAMKLSNVLAAFVIFIALTGLFAFIYSEFRAEYGLQAEEYTADGRNVAERLAKVNSIEGLNTTITAIYKLSSPTGALDILGGLKAAATGVLKTLTGIISFPVEIIGAIGDFYYIPSQVSVAVTLVGIVYIGFVIIRNWTQEEN